MRLGPILCILLLLLMSQIACSDDVTSSGGEPTCRILSPGSGTTFNFGDTLDVEVEASFDGGGKLSVEFYVGETLWRTDDKAPFTYRLEGIPYRIGTHKISAVAVADEGSSASDSVEVSIVSALTPVYGATVISEYPHDDGAFIQGLIIEDGFFYEGTGQHGRSSIRQVEIETGTVLRIREIPDEYFGEGITIIGSTFYQLTWQSHVGFVYDVADFDSLGSFSYSGEGWGLTTDGIRLIMSDGTSQVRFLDPNTFEVTGTMEVTTGGFPVSALNELELVEGDLFANRLYDTRIARISMETGEIVGWIELRDITADHRTQGVLNGIAYDPLTQELYVTGKNWDKVYKIELTH
jgi:glutamine cyclotransferase